MFHARDGAIFSKNSTFVFFDGASPITENGIQLRSPSPIMAPASALIVENGNLLFWQNLCTKFLTALPAETSQTTTSLQQK